MKSIADATLACMEACGQRGMKPPYIVCAANSHGSVLCLRFTERHSEGKVFLKAQTLCEREEAGLLLGEPIALMIVDQDGSLAGFKLVKDNDTFVVKQ
jgi:hypothetical protein